MEATPDGALRSFWAAAICLPAFLALRMLAWAGTGEPEEVARSLAAELIGYACTWVGFALASLTLAEAAQRRGRWPRFIAAWNWTNVVQYIALLSMTVPAALGLPAFLGHGLGLAAVGYALWLEWFVTRAALDISGGRAALFVLLDLLIGLFVGGLVGRLAEGG
jgi:hypothetical protein